MHIIVDELSLIRDEPVRVKINCRNPSAIRCDIEVFFNKVGHEIRFTMEDATGKGTGPKGGPHGPRKRMMARVKRIRRGLMNLVVVIRRRVINLTEWVD